MAYQIRLHRKAKSSTQQVTASISGECFLAGNRPAGGAQPPYLGALTQASTAGNARALSSVAIAIVSSARAVITRPPEVNWAGANAVSSAAWASSLKLVMRLATNWSRN